MYMRYNIFWKESGDLVDLHNLLKNSGAYEANLAVYDEKDTHGTAFFIKNDYIEEFENIVEKYNLTIDNNRLGGLE